MAGTFQPNDFLAGAFTGKGDVANDPALKFLHGTTTLGFIFNGGIILSVDSRASMGSYIGELQSLSFSVFGNMCTRDGFCARGREDSGH